MSFTFELMFLDSCFQEYGVALRNHGNRTETSSQNSRCSSSAKRQDCNNGTNLKGHADEDAKLMRKISNGDSEAFRCIYNKYYIIIKSFLAKHNNYQISSDDFIQDVFTRLWQNRESFRYESLFTTYLPGIAQNTLNEKIREFYKVARIKDPKRITHSSMDFNSDGLSQPEAEFYDNELGAVLEQINAILTTEQRQALEASQDVNTSMTDISENLGCSYQAMRNRLKRARKRLAGLLEHILDNE